MGRGDTTRDARQRSGSPTLPTSHLVPPTQIAKLGQLMPLLRRAATEQLTARHHD
ncbi:hypothetical protein BE221DRAFT_192987 [Ostreococcus tauri]|uniref:Uncharacterized protein n=1 Tax=Ostreococcus tauri TaxID=70448 RepID=A0A1Y5I6Y6_OSTTA|nr:hypothetical protein BE221DRAFT_192987 [Ostreococcus tauri]